MPGTFTHEFNSPVYKGTSTINTGLFINGQWVDPVEKAVIDVINPSTGKKFTSVALGSSKDVDIAVDAARKAFKTSWGLKCPGVQRGKLLYKLAELIEANADELAALEAVDIGKPWKKAKMIVESSASMIRYCAGWADKVHGQTIETNEGKLAYTRHEPFGVVGTITPWNAPIATLAWKLAPALATGNTLVMKPSELTPLTALRVADLIQKAGFPPGVVNIIIGYGHTVGQAMSDHPLIGKLSFTGSGVTGRKVLKSSADSNLKSVTMELGGKSPTIIFNDADVDQAVKWSAHGIFFNMGQACAAGSRIYLQEGIYDEFLAKFTEVAQALTGALGDPFDNAVEDGPLISQIQCDRVMGYIDSGKKDGATVHLGGGRLHREGYFVQPTIFTDCQPHMKIMQEEIFGPVAAIIKFKTEEEVIDAANASTYGLACSVLTADLSRAFRVAHQLEAGTAFINSVLLLDGSLPFVGHKESGIGGEHGQYALALDTYTQVKSVHVNIGIKL